MATSAQDIVDAIDALILAKLQGTWDGLADRRLGGALRITQSTTIRELRALRDYYRAQVSAESGGAEETIVYG